MPTTLGLRRMNKLTYTGLKHPSTSRRRDRCIDHKSETNVDNLGVAIGWTNLLCQSYIKLETNVYTLSEKWRDGWTNFIVLSSWLKSWFVHLFSTKWFPLRPLYLVCGKGAVVKMLSEAGTNTMFSVVVYNTLHLVRSGHASICWTPLLNPFAKQAFSQPAPCRTHECVEARSRASNAWVPSGPEHDEHQACRVAGDSAGKMFRIWNQP